LSIAGKTSIRAKRGCGERPLRANLKGSVTGHDFSHADKANQIDVGL